MTACLYCQEPVEENALFCRSCGASLRIPEYDRAFCPHCGARVSSKQEFCHECNWSLVKPPAPAQSPKSPSPSPAKPAPWKNPWVWGLLVGVGLLIAVLPWIFISGAPSPPGPGAPVPKVIQEKPVTIAPAPAPPPPAAPQAGKAAGPPVSETPLAPAVLKEQLAEVLRQLREAQLRKDIASYNQVFSSDFPDFAKRRQKTLAVWEAYDYPGLDFELAEVKLLDGDHALAQVTWNLTVREKKTQIAKSESQTYKVWFSKVGGQWRISNLEMVRKSG